MSTSPAVSSVAKGVAAIAATATIARLGPIAAKSTSPSITNIYGRNAAAIPAMTTIHTVTTVAAASKPVARASHR